MEKPEIIDTVRAQKIDNISINDQFWVQFKDSLISYGLKVLPKNVHFTLSFENESEDINFHITKETGLKDKPQIKILLINKARLIDMLPTTLNIMFNMLFKRLNVRRLKRKYKSSQFFPFDFIESPEAQSVLETEFVNGFKPITKLRKKTRLKINGNIEDQMSSMIESKQFQDMIFNFAYQEARKSNYQPAKGVVMLPTGAIGVFCIGQQWYSMRRDIKIKEFIGSVISSEMITEINWKIKRSLIAIKHAECYQDVKHLNDPIRLL